VLPLETRYTNVTAKVRIPGLPNGSEGVASVLAIGSYKVYNIRI
jgi:hypothetical protein